MHNNIWKGYKKRFLTAFPRLPAVPGCDTRSFLIRGAHTHIYEPRTNITQSYDQYHSVVYIPTTLPLFSAMIEVLP